jgi:hypothetical protein
MGFEGQPPLPVELVELIDEAIRSSFRPPFSPAVNDIAAIAAQTTLKWNRAQIDGGA